MHYYKQLRGRANIFIYLMLLTLSYNYFEIRSEELNMKYSRHKEIVSRYAYLVMARDATKWATELFHPDGTFTTSGKTFTGHEAMIDAANHLFSLFTSINYDVHKFNSLSEDQILTEGTVTYTVTSPTGETRELEPIPIWAEFDLVPSSMLISHYRGHVDKSTLFAASGDLAEQTWIELETEVGRKRA